MLPRQARGAVGGTRARRLHARDLLSGLVDMAQDTSLNSHHPWRVVGDK